jgi:hypothetical protein
MGNEARRVMVSRLILFCIGVKMEVLFSKQLDKCKPIEWIISEMKKGTHEIGFIPRCAIERYHHRGDICIVVENGDMLAFCVSYAQKEIVRIVAMWTRIDARRIAAATFLLQHIENVAAHWNKKWITLWCAADIAAVQFWQAQKYVSRDVRHGSLREKRMHFKFMKALDGAFPLLTPPDEALLLLPLKEAVASAQCSHSLSAWSGRKAALMRVTGRDQLSLWHDPIE